MSTVRQTAFRDPVPGNTFLGAAALREYISFPLDTLAGSGIVVMSTIANDAGNQHILSASDSASNTVGSIREHQTNSGNTDNALFAYIATSVISRGIVGIATAGSDATHLADSTQSWVTNEWVGVQVLDYLGNTRTVTSNTSTILTVNSGTSIASGAQYVLGGYIRVNNDVFGDFSAHTASEVSGVSSVIASSHAYPTVASGTDNISSGTAALGSSPVLIWGGCYDDTNNATSVPNAGTGNTSLGTSWTWTTGAANARFQYRAVSNPGTTDSKFSSLASNNYNTFMVAFADTVSNKRLMTLGIG